MGKMEVDAVVEMFKRSEDLHGLKYCQYIGDGNSKTFKGILDAKPYGNYTVTKKECIDHVRKRMGTRLRNLKKNVKGLGGKGKLTGKLIDELTLYYGLAIRQNTNCVTSMKKEIFATLYQKMSTNDKPQHKDCPKGHNSWCSWQKAKALKQLSNYEHKPPLKKEIFNVMSPIYKDLVKDELLQRCLGGYTQNSNESFNSSVWAISPKTIHSGKIVVDIAADIATCNFNDGLNSLMQIMQVLNLKIGPTCYKFCVEADAARVQRAEKRMTEAAKDARRTTLAARKLADYENTNVEGHLYGAGIAD